ncbi:hypothetical protein Tco_0694745 [Tanacetum coccineum]
MSLGAGVAGPTSGMYLVGQLRAAYKSVVKGLVGATASIHQLSHATDYPGGEPALISDRSVNISSQPHNALSQLLHLLFEPGNPLLYSPRGRSAPGAPVVASGYLSGPGATQAHASPTLTDDIK